MHENIKANIFVVLLVSHNVRLPSNTCARQLNAVLRVRALCIMRNSTLLITNLPGAMGYAQYLHCHREGQILA